MHTTLYKSILLVGVVGFTSIFSYSQEKNYSKLVQTAIENYELDEAMEHIDAWEEQLKKKKMTNDQIADLKKQVLDMQNMLERVEQLTIIDSLIVDKDEFFKHYKLSPDAGRLYDKSVLPPQYSELNPEVVFKPQSKGEIFWGMPNSKDVVTIVSSQILDDGTFLEPVVLGDVLNEGGDADYPYMMSDGTTFYFSNTGDNSIGGYDIFLSRRSADGSVLQPQNIGMPYNSPYDDYMLVIDEAAGLGWWATDRNQIPGKVTIYVFVPNETRVNYDPDDDNIIGFAKVTSIKATQKGKIDKDALLNNPVLNESENKENGEDLKFTLVLSNGKIYTSLSEFKNSQAKRVMRQYLEKQNDLDVMLAQLTQLRMQYASGDKSVSSDILQLEKRVNAARSMLSRLRNQTITLETK